MNQSSAQNLTFAIRALEKRSDKYRRRLLSYKAAKNFYKNTTLVAHRLRNKSTQILAGAGLVGTLLVTPIQSPISTPSAEESAIHTTVDFSSSLDDLTSLIPHQPSKLDSVQAKAIEEKIEMVTGIKARAILDGESLNHQVGIMGAEQHLPRYPGDTLDQHDEIQASGITPGLGAWRYFANSKDQFTTQDYVREKYYVVAQTLYLPDWDTRFKYLRDWYKYRKVIVINPANGKSVVADIADAGPADWTGKQFGGSPEVIQDLNLYTGSKKGLVVFLFVDDPENKIPLGPVTKKY